MADLSGDGDPSQDVAHASVLFLVDAKLVLLQSSLNEEGSLKYDMRVIANRVEYFDLMRDQVSSLGTPAQSPAESPSSGSPIPDINSDHGLKDSLWYFDGNQVRCWIDVEELLQSASAEGLPDTVSVSTDFYPSSIILKKGIILGVEAELIQRRDVSFAFFRFCIRVGFPPEFSVMLAKFKDTTFPPTNATPLPLRLRQPRCIIALPSLRFSPLFPPCS